MDVRFPPLTAIVSVCFCFWAMRPMSGFGVDPNFGFRPIADFNGPRRYPTMVLSLVERGDEEAVVWREGLWDRHRP